MPWNTWIKIEPKNTYNEEAIRLYENTKNPITKNVSDLTRITSLTPEVSELINKLCISVYKNATGLSAREKEIAALVTSSLNGCVH
jgi:alkylhydroperoxidase family enzyme